jgi:hypothetical protein
VLQKKTFSPDGRCEAIHIIEACEIQKLSPLLAKLALDFNENQGVREIAAQATSKLADSKIKQKLKPIALGKTGEDLNLELRGWGLKACWPGLISASEIFSTIVEPDHRGQGSYARFLSSDLVEGLSVVDLPVALRWAAAQPESHGRTSGFAWLAMQILRRAVLHLDHELVKQEFAKAMLSRLRKHDFAMGHEVDCFINAFEAKPEQRLSVVDAMLRYFEDPRHDAMLITCWGFRYVGPHDLFWLLSLLKAEASPSIQKGISNLIYRVYRPDDAKRADAVINAADACSVLADVLSVWLKPMDLSSEESANAKKMFLEDERWKKEAEERKQPKILKPTPAERICACLSKFEAGDLDAWWHACCCAELEDDGQNAKDWYQLDLHELPGWKKATDETKARLVEAARRYAVKCQAEPEVWFHWKNKTYRPAVGGLRALLLLSKEDANFFEDLSKEVWIRWIPAILGTEHFGERDEFRMLATIALEKAPQESVEWTLKVLNKENKEGDWPSILNKLPTELGPILGPALLARLKRGKLKVRCANQILEMLIEQKIHGALKVASGYIPMRPPKQAKRRDLTLFASRLLLKYGEGGNWSRIRRLIIADTSFGRSLLEGGAFDYHHHLSLLVRTLNESDISGLWEWVRVQYPAENDPIERKSGRGGTITLEWAMADIRDGLLGYLADLGTLAACRELLRLTQKHPKFSSIRHMLSRSKEQMRRNSWQPPSPRNLFQLAENRRHRFVQNADQLLDLVCDALESLQGKLHGATPAARFLWDRDRPKEEEALSDWVKLELEAALVNKGIILNREVQIHIKERTDIHVDAVTRDPHTKELESLKLIIEVKGCWHRELKTAMETQLLSRYLSDNDCRHGIYLVFWFLCSAWSKKDPRVRNKFTKHQALVKYLSEQASRLSLDGKRIRPVLLDASLPWIKKRKPKRNSSFNRSHKGD